MNLSYLHKPTKEIETEKRSSKRTYKLTKLNLEMKKKIKCHVCREKQEGRKIIICTNYQSCKHSFCHKCIDTHFRTRVRKEYLKNNEENWPCFVCRGLCKCKRCKAALASELAKLVSLKSSDSSEDSKPYIRTRLEYNTRIE